MSYLLASEYENYGVDAQTPPQWVAAASSLVDSYCRRTTLNLTQYTERLRMASGRNTLHLTYLPLAALAPATIALVAGRGRYALPRRGEEVPLSPLAEVAMVFGLPGTWVALDVTTIDYQPDFGELNFPVNVLGLGFNEVEITYTAGLAVIPDKVKFAVAQIVRNAQATPALNVKKTQLDRLRMEYFSDSLIDSTVRMHLATYVAQKVG